MGEYPNMEGEDDLPLEGRNPHRRERWRGSHMDEGRIISYAGGKREGITIWKWRKWSLIRKRRGDLIRKREGIFPCRKIEVGDPNMEEDRRSLCVGRKR